MELHNWYRKTYGSNSYCLLFIGGPKNAIYDLLGDAIGKC